jgi:putative ABC transport system substrate-binding protein
MRRREFTALLGGMVFPFAVRAQRSPPIRRIGVLMGIAEGDVDARPRASAFQQGLQELGWMEGQNIRIEYRWAAGDPKHIQAFAVELVAWAPDVILANTTPVLSALRSATRTIPIVFVQVVDPIGGGMVSSLARPGGNATGYVNFEFSMAGKWLETLKQIAPGVARVGLLFNPETAPFGHSFVQVVEASASTFAVDVVAILARNTAELEGNVVAFAARPNGGLIILPDLFNTGHREAIVLMAAQRSLPAVYPFRYFAESGGLIADGVEALDLFRRSASYVDRILKGERPGDLPVQQPTKFELVINLKTAKALGLTVPSALLARADEVIE